MACGSSDADDGAEDTGDVAQGEDTGDLADSPDDEDLEGDGAGTEDAGDAPDTGTDGNDDSGEDGTADVGSDTTLTDVTGATITPGEGGEASSADGLLSLVFPAGAVSADTEVSAQAVDPDDIPWDLPESVNVVSAYRLEPSGLTLDEPAVLRLSRSFDDHVLEGEDGEYRMMFLVSYSEDGTSELLTEPSEVGPPLLRTEIDMMRQQVDAVAPIHHFSWVVAVEWDISLAFFPGGVEARDGEYWPTQVKWNNHRNATYEIRDIAMTVRPPLELRDIERLPEGHWDRTGYGDTFSFHRGEMWLTNRYLAPSDRSEWQISPWIGCKEVGEEPGEIIVTTVMVLEGASGNFLMAGYMSDEDDVVFHIQVRDQATCAARPDSVAPRCDPTNPLTDPLQDVANNLGDVEDILCAEMVNLLDLDNEQPTRLTNGAGPNDPGNDDAQESLARGAGLWDLSESDLNAAFHNTFYPCGAGDHGYTVCPESPADLAAGDFVIAYQVMKGEIPVADAANHYQYGFVFDSDALGDNNYWGSLPYDFFADSDRWYEALYDPDDGWSLKVSTASSSSSTEVASEARVIIDGAAIVLVVPASEFTSEAPPYRVTAFRHTGDWGLEDPYDWNGDMSPPLNRGLAPFDRPQYIAPIVRDCPTEALVLGDDPLSEGDKIAGLLVDRETGACSFDAGTEFAASRVAYFVIADGDPKVAVPLGMQIEDVSHTRHVGTVTLSLPDGESVTVRLSESHSGGKTWEVTFRFDAAANQVVVEQLFEVPEPG